jgi:oligosaccharide repeat unit polymerase
MVILILIALILLFYQSFVLQKDYFAPSKFYILYLLLYFTDIFLNEQSDFAYVIYLLYILLGFVFTLMERNNIPIRRKGINFTDQINDRKILLILWGFSIIPILSQLYLILHFGGFEAYVGSVKLRVLNWKGMGVFIVLKQMMPIINIVYLVLGLMFRVKKIKWWCSYFFHSGIMFYIGVLSGSRGVMIFSLVCIIIAINYFVRKIKIKRLVLSIIILVVVTGYLGIVRNNFKYTDQGFETDYKIQDLTISDVKIFKYGLVPLNIIFKKEYSDYKLGSTFLSLGTIFIPRTIFPDKLKTGGEVLTKFDHGYEYTGTVNYSTGLYTESVLNFGYYIGAFVFVIIMLLTMQLSSNVYRKFLRLKNERSYLTIKYFYYYMATVTIPASFLIGEFTKIGMGLITNTIFFILILKTITFNIKLFSRK